MFEYSAFEDDFTTQGQQIQKQFWEIDFENTDEVLRWCNNEIKNQAIRWLDDFWEMRQNLARYEGRYYNEPDQRLSRQRGNYQRLNPFSRKYNKIAVNHLRDFTEARVSRLTKFRPAFAVVPGTNEYEDKIDARVAEKVVRAKWDEEHVEELIIKWLRSSDVQGESYLFTLWNPYKGPRHPLAKDLPVDLPVEDQDAEGEESLNTSNMTLKPLTAGAIRTGDIEYKIFQATNVYLQNKKRWEDVDWIMPFERVPTADLKLMYPNADGDIKADKIEIEYQEDPMQTGQMMEEATVYYLFYRPTLALPKGRKVFFTKSAVLLNEDYDFTSDELPGELPCVRFCSDEIPGKLRGQSLYRHLKPLNDHLNTLTTMIVRQQILCAHPKWMVPWGSVKPENLGNDITMVQFKGPVPPSLAAFNPTAAELFKFRGDLKDDLQQLSGVFGTSRGEPPAGIKAGVALQFLSEQENERFNLQVVRYQAAIRELVRKTLLVIANKYEDGDDRILKTVGSWTGMDEEVINFKVAQLRKKFNIRIQNSSSLPDSKAARIQNILDLADRYPDRFNADQVLDMMGMAAEQKFIDQSTLAINAAESENERLLAMNIGDPIDGYMNEIDVIAPVEYENHVEHWRCHFKVLQEQRFKYLPQEIQQRLIDHITAHEMFMIQKSMESNSFAQQVSALPQFPLFFKVQAPTELTADLDQQSLQAASMAAAQPAGIGGASAPSSLQPQPSSQRSGRQMMPPPGQPEPVQAEPLPQAEPQVSGGSAQLPNGPQ